LPIFNSPIGSLVRSVQINPYVGGLGLGEGLGDGLGLGEGLGLGDGLGLYDGLGLGEGDGQIQGKALLQGWQVTVQVPPPGAGSQPGGQWASQ